MSAPENRLDDAFRNRLANSLIAIRRQLIDTYATGHGQTGTAGI